MRMTAHMRNIVYGCLSALISFILPSISFFPFLFNHFLFFFFSLLKTNRHVQAVGPCAVAGAALIVAALETAVRIRPIVATAHIAIPRWPALREVQLVWVQRTGLKLRKVKLI